MVIQLIHIALVVRNSSSFYYERQTGYTSARKTCRLLVLTTPKAHQHSAVQRNTFERV